MSNNLAAYYKVDQIQRQLEFVDFFLKGKTDNGLKGSPRIDLLIRRRVDNFYRAESAWPPEDATQTFLYLAPNEMLSFAGHEGSSPDEMVTYAGLTGVNFFQTAPLKKLEIL